MIRLSLEDVRTRQFITRFFLERGFAPSRDELAAECRCTLSEADGRFRSLAGNRALVLHPHRPDIWIAHPFSDAPNAIWVETADRAMGWWSNCPMCAFGIAALAKRDVRILGRLGAEGTPIEVEVIDGTPKHDGELVVHMPIPVPQWWDNVVYSCSMQLFFRSETEIDDWCRRHRKTKGGIVSVAKMWELARGWYGTYLETDWNRRSPDEVQAYFTSIGLALDFKPLR